MTADGTLVVRSLRTLESSLQFSVVCGVCFFFFFQAEDGIRDLIVTGVQTCALPIYQDGVGDDGDAPIDERMLEHLADEVLVPRVVGMHRHRGVAEHGLGPCGAHDDRRSEEHTSELQSRSDLVCRLLLEKKKTERSTPSLARITRLQTLRGTQGTATIPPLWIV